MGRLIFGSEVTLGWLELSQGECREGKGAGIGPERGEKVCWRVALGTSSRACPALSALLDSRQRQRKLLPESLPAVRDNLLLLVLPG